MTISARPLLVSGVAFISAGAVALGPAVIAPSALPAAKPVVHIPAVQIQNIQLAGIGRAIYDGAVQPAVEAVQNVIQNAVELVPFVGDPISNQIGIAFELANDLVQPTVYYLSTLWSSLFNDIWAIPQWTGVYVWSLAAAPLNAIASELEAFGLPSPNIPGPPVEFPPNDFPIYNLITGRRAPAPAATEGTRAPRTVGRAAAAARGTAKAATAKSVAKPAGARKARAAAAK